MFIRTNMLVEKIVDTDIIVDWILFFLQWKTKYITHIKANSSDKRFV